ncbi:Permease of the drug/metabolite transporter (DMT) superfamily [Halorubrum aquaticum]|uniref:Permease of the drug/metabolite transporter (DMT) superfamily n=1 Tax=Halorubrum aquaticum TaxID=387340 RepID=A0A1I3BKZ7_9EURY|nr:DMT family transporter [Halorubrum aquaticum]SFH62599.1 Permease of the drug/metabolite transporter (DMT) superfamily [Halorubrum aquaticum]
MSRYRNLSLFLVLAAVWGSAFMAINAGLAYFPPVLFAALRYDIAGVVVLGYAAYVVDDPIPRGRGEWKLVAVGAVLLIAAYHAFLFIGQTDPEVTSAVASVTVGLSPVLTTVFARAFLPSERLTLLGVVGLLVGLAGAGVLAAPDPANLTAGGTVAKFLVLLAAAAFALGSVLTRALDVGMEIETMEAWSMLFGAAIMHAIAFGLGESMAEVVWTTDAVLALGYLAVFASGLGYLIYFDLLDRLGPIEINLVSYVAPVFAALSGWLVLDEGLTPNTIAGFLLICCGFALVKRATIREELRRKGVVA